MYCPNCGKQILETQRFCTSCGKPIAAPFVSAQPLPVVTGMGAPSTVVPDPTRVSRHLRTLGILWIIVSGLRLIPGLAMMGVGHLGIPFVPWHLTGFVAPLLGGIGVFMSVTAVAGLAAGWGLLDRRPWARTLAVILGCVKLIDVPFGTALGIYTLWVLVSSGGDAEYERLTAGR